MKLIYVGFNSRDIINSTMSFLSIKITWNSPLVKSVNSAKLLNHLKTIILI